MDIGERIKAIRKQKKITQEQLASPLGLTTSAISKYEKGLVSPSWETLEKIAAFFDMTIEDLLYNVNALSYDPELRKNVAQTMQRTAEDLPKTKLLSAFDKLNDEGQKTAIERVEELTEIPKYTKPE